MTSDTPARDFLLPGLRALVDQARARGIAADVAAAVIIDLMTGPAFNTVTLDPRQDDPPAHPDAAPIQVSEVAAFEGDAIREARSGIGSGRRGRLLTPR